MDEGEPFTGLLRSFTGFPHTPPISELPICNAALRAGFVAPGGMLSCLDSISTGTTHRIQPSGLREISIYVNSV